MCLSFLVDRPIFQKGFFGFPQEKALVICSYLRLLFTILILIANICECHYITYKGYYCTDGSIVSFVFSFIINMVTPVITIIAMRKDCLNFWVKYYYCESFTFGYNMGHLIFSIIRMFIYITSLFGYFLLHNILVVAFIGFQLYVAAMARNVIVALGEKLGVTIKFGFLKIMTENNNPRFQEVVM